jgi:diguanylate cyclase (GGDEF)-like protein
VTTDQFIFAVLLLVNALMSLAMLLASRTLGQPRMARLLAAAFGGNVLLYATDAVYFFHYLGNPWLNLLVCAMAMAPPIPMAMAYRLRSGLPLRTGAFLAGHALAMLAIAWFSFGDPNRGAQGAMVEIYSAAALSFAVTALWRPGRRLRLGERPVIIASCGMVAIGVAGAAVMAAMGNDRSPALENAYTLIVFLALPAMTVASGIFSLYLLAGDLAERLRIAADTDSLTGAPNRRAIEASGTRMIDEARAVARPLIVAICDVDHFKDINDLYGHSLGDEVLCRLAILFREHVAEPHHFGRFGGEEFVLFFPDMDSDTAHRRVEALRDRIMAIRVPGLPVALTASFGVAAMSAEDRILADIVKRADLALYASKQAGRNRTTFDRQIKPAA